MFVQDHVSHLQDHNSSRLLLVYSGHTPCLCVCAWSDYVSAGIARISCLPCVFNDGYILYDWFNKTLPTYTENIFYWRYLRSCFFLNKLWWRAGWCEAQLFDVSLCPSRCFCSVISPISPPPLRPPVCVCVCMWFCCFCSNQTERRSVADVRGGLANSSSPPMRRSPAHFPSPAPHATLTPFLLIHPPQP